MKSRKRNRSRWAHVNTPAGLMTKRSGGPLSGGDPVYRVTDAGMDALLVGRKTPND